VAEAKARMLACGLDYHGISYLFVLESGGPVLGVVDARQILISTDEATMASLMISPVVSAEVDDSREDLRAIFSKYHFRMFPVVDAEDHILGVVHYNDIMKSGAKA
jgi:magnesium transporter